MKRFGAFVAGTKVEKEEDDFSSILLIPYFFILRRSILCLALIYWRNYLCGQLFAAYMTSTL